MSLLSSIFAPGEQARGDALDAQLNALNDRAYADGKISADELRRRQDEQAANYIDVGGQVDQAFVEGAKEGYDNTTGFIKSTIAAPFKFVWDILPWEVWLGGAVFLFVYMGGWVWIKGILKRR